MPTMAGRVKALGLRDWNLGLIPKHKNNTKYHEITMFVFILCFMIVSVYRIYSYIFSIYNLFFKGSCEDFHDSHSRVRQEEICSSAASP